MHPASTIVLRTSSYNNRLRFTHLLLIHNCLKDTLKSPLIMHFLKMKSTISVVTLLSLNLFTTAHCYQNSTCNSIYGGSFGALEQPYYPPAADCRDYMIPVDIKYDNYAFNASQWKDNYGLTDFLSIATTRAGADTRHHLLGPKQRAGHIKSRLRSAPQKKSLKRQRLSL